LHAALEELQRTSANIKPRFIRSGRDLTSDKTIFCRPFADFNALNARPENMIYR